MAAVLRVTSRNARFQQWQALLANRSKRQRAREFLVQGVRPITIAVERGWPVRTLIFDGSRPLSGWARELLRTVGAEQVAMSPELLAELGEKGETAPEVIAVAEIPDDDLGRIAVGPRFLVVVFDRPASPGNIGSIIRSADAFGADGVIVTGHAADVYDPKSVRASTGSLFGVPAVRVPSHREVIAWAAECREQGYPVRIVGTDEHSEADLFDFDLTGPTLLLIGNETTGLSAAWREACDHMVRIPMSGTASSLNAASAATAILYEAARQRARATLSRPRPPRRLPGRDYDVRVAKVHREHVWHVHNHTDELFLVLDGELHIALRAASGERTVVLSRGSVITVPRGVQARWHLPGTGHGRRGGHRVLLSGMNGTARPGRQTTKRALTH